MKDTPHFESSEFVCSCCGLECMFQPFIDKLEQARTASGIPFNITSGTRCPAHNAKVGGTLDSSHLCNPDTGYSYAADIAVWLPRKRMAIVGSLIVVGFARIGIHEYYIHVDEGPGKSPAMWIY